MSDYNLQPVFDTIARHLLTQNAKSMLEGPDRDACAYRGSGGRQCAIGCIIKDEFYNPLQEGVGLGGQRVSEAVTYSLGIDGMDTGHLYGMLGHLQYIHDVSKVELWPELLHRAAVFYSLNPAVIVETLATRGRES